MNKRKTWDNVVAGLGSFFRVSILPIFVANPLKVFTESLLYNLDFPTWIYQIIIALVMTGLETIGLNRLFYKLSFLTVGTIYRKGACKAYGSFLYTVFYTLFTVSAVFIIKNFIIQSLLLIALLFWTIFSLLYYISGRLKFLPSTHKHILGYGIVNVSFIVIDLIVTIFCKLSWSAFIFTLCIIIAMSLCCAFKFRNMSKSLSDTISLKNF